IGVGQDGLVHISELSDKYVRRPMDVVSVGEQVKVRVINIDIDRARISLSMKGA
ncbi:MAG TPA: S1 RNA-binding domain-containing protein, partial [Thermoanaerobacterales bacterium]|nr:S1 RNA-binding domain-containing protein [Thermoanaerobacterales bacterium]